MEWLLLILIGWLAGVVNTLSGSGSIFTLSALLLLNVPIDIANGTNRLGILSQSIASLITLRKHLPPFSVWFRVVLPAWIGSLIGAWLATFLEKELLEKIVAYMMLLLIPSVFLNTQKWSAPFSSKPPTFKPWLSIVFLGLGIYGGFIQIGVAIVFTIFLVQGAHFSPFQANILKILIIALYTFPVMLIFIIQEKFHWQYAVLLSVGQAIGGRTTAQLAIRYPNINLHLKYFLVFMILVTATKSLFF
ncbi:MAG: sulfite exporter TauE/SafE family protein [Cytophagales bacterium]|nr:sulfite exporter TauE/SafE family protein [Cytophagales bacterium]MDW8385187.1 sulfite exporter TauE/SafE family protein [Flammeovirgaceae bacterium]